MHDSAVATRQAAREAALPEPGRELDEVDERVVRHGYRRWVFVGGVGRREQPGLGDAGPDRAARATSPLSVKYVAPDDAGPDLDRVLAGERQGLAVGDDLSGRADARVELAVDPDLEPGAAALDRHDEVDALVDDRHVARQRRGLALRAEVAVTVIVQRPAVSSSGVLNEPSSATWTVTEAGTGGRRGGRRAGRPPAGRTSRRRPR